MQEIKLPNKPIYLHPPACAVMICFIHTNGVSENQVISFEQKKNPRRFNFFCAAALSCSKKEKRRQISLGTCCSGGAYHTQTCHMDDK